ncbi:MAG: hypothetical protein Q8K99_13225 [Actinomycetota bacterium]|nr:hypothetical protein [Actinomycetota bacterium]
MAVVLGLGFGVVLLLISRASFRGITAEDPFRGLVVAAISLFLRLGLAVAVLYAYDRFADSGFLPFALAFAAGFLALYMVELVRFGGLHRYLRPRSGPGIGGR